MMLVGPTEFLCDERWRIFIKHLLTAGYYELGDRNFALSVWPWITAPILAHHWTTGATTP